MMVAICRQGAAVAGWAVTALYACWARPPRLIKTSPALSSLAAAMNSQSGESIGLCREQGHEHGSNYTVMQG